MVRAVALFLTTLTGFSGLVYEVAWQRYLFTLLGSDSEAVAAILGIYLGGLALGYRLYARVTRDVTVRAQADATRALLVLYGGTEAAVGVLAVVFPWSFVVAQRLSVLIPHGSPALGFTGDVVLATCLIGPPAVLMGGTIPVLTQALAVSVEDAARVHALIYGFNTAGAFAGAAAAGFVLIPALGLVSVVRWMGAINLAAGATFLVLGMARGRTAVSSAEASSAALEVPQFMAFAVVALLSGFATITLQTVLIRMGGLSLGSSQFTFSIVVATFVLCIALGSFAVAGFRRIRAGAVVAVLWASAIAFTALYIPLDDGPYWAYRLRLLFGRSNADFYPYYVSTFLVFLGLFALPIGLAGALLPMMFAVLRQRFGGLGALAGRLYSWNTVGCLLGALVGGYALLFWFNLNHVYRIGVATLLIAACFLGWVLLARRHAVANLVCASLGLAILVLLPAWDPLRLSVGFFRHREPVAQAMNGPRALAEFGHESVDVPFYADDPVGSVTVWERKGTAATPSRSVRVNGKSEGEIPTDYVTMSLVALIPAWIAQDCARSFVIGYGTGVTAGELAALGCARSVEVAEISPAVIAAAPLFDYGNQDASRNPKVAIIRADAYRALLRSSERYDVISSEPSNPWVAGVEMLFSREFLELARDRLAPGGVFAQWIHLYEIDTDSVRMIFRTFTSVFDRVAVWHMLDQDIMLLGINPASTPLDLDRLEARFSQADFRAGFGRAGVPDFASLLAREVYPVGVPNAVVTWHTDIHTLLHPLLNSEAARAFFRGDQAEIPSLVSERAEAVGRENSLLRRYAARFGGTLPEESHRHAVEETCKYSLKLCLTMLAEWKAKESASPVVAELLERYLHLSTSAHADSIVRALVPLFGSANDGDGDSLQQARDASALFMEYYHHAAPFDRAALLSAWRRCPGGLQPGSECLAGLEETERYLGSLRD
ncbi:MAG TPA: fused MFS/spermidine synthase [Candidatus Binatia bacterium]|nr:fused MFS/spermidine synthase [Candidatus Binatia bacterium]